MPVLVDEAAVTALVRSLRRVAVLGIKTAEQADQPAFYVAESLARAGVEIVPVPVYYPDATEILGQQVYRRLVDVPGELDAVCVFRRSRDVAAHEADLLGKRPRAVWFQLGIFGGDTTATLAEAGIAVVENRCLMVDHRRFTAA